MITTILFLVIAYLTGSIATAIVACKLFGLPDPRTQNSGNPGMANVLRIGGKLPALITLLGDALKAIIPILIAKLFKVEGFSLALVGLAAFLGHLYPIFFKFKGGKGVATGFGALLVLSPSACLLAALTWLIIAVIFRYFSLAAIVAAAAAPVYLLVYSDPRYLPPMTVMMLMIIWKHRKNIKRLRSGTESKIKF
jgi:glycerol-3-phosphate acyltransferase PlsY